MNHIVAYIDRYGHPSFEEHRFQMFFKGGNLFRKLSLLAHLYPRIIKDK